MSSTISRKCKGCGKPLSLDKKDIGYIPNLDFDYCQRCFRLMNYGVNTKSELSISETQQVLDELMIKDKDWIFLVQDIINIDEQLIDKFKNHKNITYIFNKADLIVDGGNYKNVQDRLISILEHHQCYSKDILLVSTFNHFGIRKLFESIKQFDLKNKAYFLGKSNSGKSSIINALIRYSGSSIRNLVTSQHLNTSIGIKQIKLHKHSIIDVPGFYSQQSILNNVVRLEDTKLFISKKKIKPITFQIKNNQAFLVENLCEVKCLCSSDASITFYIPSRLKIQRCKIENIEKNLKQIKTINISDVKKTDHDFNLDGGKYNIIIDGLGLISCKGIKKITVKTFENTLVSQLPHYII